MSFSTLLVANRGEIACRILRSARKLGWRTVAVFSEADAGAAHVLQADRAVCIGPAPARESYLHIERLLQAARDTGADAVHPGYGFLSERADFAQACLDAGLVFVGPPPAAIEAMGHKAAAKRRMLAAGVPCLAGYLGEQQDDGALADEALALGFPLLVKAVAGGGGRGMRQVNHLHDLPQALDSARREALKAFGDGRLMLERLVEHGRHIEIQVFCDGHGSALHLGERDCTAQRRRQKLIEESPSPVVDAALREAMGRDALAAARAVGYVGAGTVEFIVDAGRQHYFLEMNTRLQVEHPVTECVSGLDLVEWQLRIAAGEPLPMQQDQVHLQGHAIEARLYAEEPADRFRPQAGRIAWWRPGVALEAAGPGGGVRIDHGLSEGDEIGTHYDALLAKFIAHGRNRDDAIRRLAAALEDAPVLGLPTNGPFLVRLLRHPVFRQAGLHTTLIDHWSEQGDPLLQSAPPAEADWLLAAGLLALGDGEARPRPPSVAGYGLQLQCAGQVRSLRATTQGRRAEVELDGRRHAVERLPDAADGRWRVALDGVQRRLVAHRDGSRLEWACDGGRLVFSEPPAVEPAQVVIDARHAVAPVSGSVVQVLVQPGDPVTRGQPLVCVEAMKMEMWLVARADGRVQALNAAPGDTVATGTVLVELALHEAGGAAAEAR
ncbi:acetyl/propionyl/methylcrotonyl-CoA carboxylase subunit alpha [Eleftheria terrae]|uniref:acetyl/propionyl/methylcrotonyl-CoA carboxylase subunit alpha n=1 Tax=Eleftheria terrae TaxID=1597781 RepID=UPI00263B58BF|nr:biotin carboxylase N-terminal domain-containing protein [Eleftheria terrae]WKB53170.1 carbamoyl-phosphate synthase subunit L [Eleftheria terrae]